MPAETRKSASRHWWSCRLLRADRRGVVAIIMGLLIIPIIGLLGLAIDYSFAVRSQSMLNAAADAAAVAATDAAANAYQNNLSSTAAATAGQAAGLAAFNAQLANLPSVTVTPYTSCNGTSAVVNACVIVTNPSGTATFNTVITYNASYTTSFGRYFLVNTFPMSGGSNAQISLSAYEDFHIVMDSSGSMGIAADATNMSTLAGLTLAASNKAYQNISPYNGTYNGQNSYLGKGSGQCSGTCGAAQSTTQGCAFGCHWDNSNSGCTNCDFYEIAKTNHVQLRQDVMQSAVQDVLNTTAGQDTFNQYRAAVYSYYTKFTTSGSTTSIASNLQVVSALPSVGSTYAALNAAATAAGSWPQPLSGTDNSNNVAGATKWPEPNTNFGAAMTTLATGMNCTGGGTTNGTYIPCPGNGTSATSPQEFVFVITDGVEDFCTSVSGTSTCNGRTIQPIQASECAALKAQGVQILVLYVQYVPLDVSPYYNSFYVGNVQPYVDPGGNTSATSQVQTNLQACASSASFFFYASSSTDINSQLARMLTAAENSGVRFTR